MDFLQRHPVPLSELLVSPVVLRAMPELAQAPLVSRSGMRDLALFAGFAPGAIRTAMSRLRSSGAVEPVVDERGTTRYRASALTRSITHTVLARQRRPRGFLLAVFSFTADAVRERQVVRDALKLHGFQKLAQNVYINGQIDTSELESVLRDRGVAEHVYLFRCSEADDPVLRRKLTEVFDLAARAAALRALGRELEAFLDDPALDGDTFARRMLYAGPVYYGATFLQEPPLPASYLPDDYPLDAVVEQMTQRAIRRAPELLDYYRRVNQE